jgi:hypothetical protein
MATRINEKALSADVFHSGILFQAKVQITVNPPDASLLLHTLLLWHISMVIRADSVEREKTLLLDDLNSP